LGVSGVAEVFVPPDAARIRVARLRIARGRVRVRAVVRGDVPSAAPFVIRVEDAQGRERAALSLPSEAFTVRGRRLIHASSDGAVRVTLTRRDRGLRVRAVLPTGSEASPGGTIRLSLADASYCGTRLRP
jgi:hypothetical protein